LRLLLAGAEQETDLVQPDWPSSAWPSGYISRGQYDMTVGAQTDAGDYALEAQLLDSGGSTVGAKVALGTIRVDGRQRIYEAPTMMHVSNAIVGGVATLLGYDLDETAVVSGNTLSLALYWRAEQEMDTSYTVFTHVIDEQDQVWGQQDNLPVAGTYPTTGWLPGEIIADEYEIGISADAPAGEYLLEIGMYDAEAGVRLPIDNAQGQPQTDDRLILTRVRIAAP
jgi:hypothetical protein